MRQQQSYFFRSEAWSNNRSESTQQLFEVFSSQTKNVYIQNVYTKYTKNVYNNTISNNIYYLKEHFT